MPFAAAISEHPDGAQACAEVAGEVLEAIGPEPSLAMLFVTGPHTTAADDMRAAVQEALAPGVLVGAAAVSIIGRDKEVEEQPAVSLWAGRVIDDNKLDFARGDFLIRGVLGADQTNGAIAVGDHIEVGTVVQFQVRDEVTADEDLRELLADRQADGALIFTCNGRGSHLFAVPSHDARVVAEHSGTSATGGMFCAGEIGPVGNRNFLHGFTASVGLFHD